MLRTRARMQLPAKKVMAEYLSRSGCPRTDSLSPYDGGYHIVSKQFSNIGINPIYFIETHTYTDWEASKVKPTEGPYMAGSTAKDYIKRLEDIDESWLAGYAKSILIGFKRNAADMVKYSQDHSESRTITDGEGKELNESEFLEESEMDYSPQQILIANDRLLYVLKRLHEKSKQCGVHLISLIIAYEKAKAVIKTRSISPADCISRRVYFMHPNGIVGGQVTTSDNTKTIFPQASKWIRDKDGMRDSYFDNMMDLLSYCKVLGIDITEEDPLEFQEPFFADKVVAYIAKNKDYVLNKNNGINMDVLNSLSSVKLEDYDTSLGAKRAKITDAFYITNTMQVLRDSIVDTTGYAEEDLLKLIPYLVCIGAILGDLDDMIAIDGFLHNKYCKPILVNMDAICRGVECPAPALIHVSGIVVQLTSSSSFYYQDAATLYSYIGSYARGTHGSDVFRNNETFGKWKMATV